jgi:hypothetical protein
MIGPWRRNVGWGTCVLVGCLGGCSPSEGPAVAPNDGVSGADAGGSGGTRTVDATGGAGGRAGDPGARISLTEACIEYAAAQLQRSAECRGFRYDRLYDLAAITTLCPDVIFSDGSSFDLDAAAACTEYWRTAPCGQMSARWPPECAPAGTRAAGEPCLYASQCESYACTAVGGQCGVCAARAAVGEPCNGVTTVCEANALCTGGTCEAYVPPEDPPPPTQAAGEPCTTSDECLDGGLCFLDLDGVSRCFARIPVGGSCDLATSYCDETVAYCDPARMCVAYPLEGEPCGLTRWSDPQHCAHGLQCHAEYAAGPICVVTTDGDVCADAGSICARGEVCCAPPACPEPSCVVLRLPGEPCGSADVRCVAGAICRDGSCASIDSQGLFDAACGP